MRLKSNFTLHKSNKLSLAQLACWIALAWPSSALPEQSTTKANELAAIKIVVRNPRCLACIKTLREYLTTFPGVQKVYIPALDLPSGKSRLAAARASTVILDITLAARVGSKAATDQARAVTARVKAHDLEILSSSPISRQSCRHARHR